MQLLRLRRRLTLAKRGHKLLKDKQEELMRRFLGMVHSARDLRAEAFSRRTVELKAEREQVMNLKVPKFHVDIPSDAEFGYGFGETTMDLDRALEMYAAVLPRLMSLAEVEKSIQLLAAELEKTRRRVNALEHILVPSLEETIRFISDRLSEMERATATRLMKIKDIVREH